MNNGQKKLKHGIHVGSFTEKEVTHLQRRLSLGTHVLGLLLGMVVPGPTTLQQRRHSQLWAVQLLQPLSF